jgi:hypothetical protein
LALTLGHSDIKTTATFYTAALVEDLREAMEATSPREIPSQQRRLHKDKSE